MTREAKARADAKWKKLNATRVTFRLYKNTDADLIEYLKTIDNKQGLIKQLLRDHMNKGK